MPCLVNTTRVVIQHYHLIRRHIESCVTAYNEKALNPVQTWLLDFSAMCHYTKFGMVSLILTCKKLFKVVQGASHEHSINVQSSGNVFKPATRVPPKQALLIVPATALIISGHAVFHVDNV